MMLGRAGDVVSAVAFGCLTVGFLMDAAAQIKRTPDHPGLPWSRVGTLGLWAGLALQAGFGMGESLPASWLKVVPALAFTAQLHLLHVPGWKGARSRQAGLWCWALAAAAFGLALFS